MCKSSNNQKLWPLLAKILDLIKNEVTTTAGKVNLISDLILAAVVATIFVASSFETIALAIISIWNNALTDYIFDANSLIAFAILVFFFVVCLIFLYIMKKINGQE